MSVLTPVWNYIDALVHSSARDDALTAARHRAFIAPRLIGSLAVLAAFPLYLAFRGVPSELEVGVFAWLVSPILVAYFLSRTGRYENAHVLSSFALTGLIATVAWCTGGIGSFAAVWLIIVPLEASLSASRYVVATASVFALLAAGLLLLVGETGLIALIDATASEHGALAALGIVSAALYAAGIALGTEHLAQTSFWLLYAEEERYRLLSHNMTDVVVRLSRDGAVLFASPGAEPLFNVRTNELMQHGLFERLHVADRPAFLNALAEAAARGEAHSLECRIRRGGDSKSQMGQFVWIEMRCQPFNQVKRFGKSEDRELVVVLRDVSERKAQERALEIVRSESERANAVKSRFLASMSHELRTPLNAIIGFSEMLMSESLKFELERKREYATLINESGRHLLSLVNDLLEMSKMEAGNFEITPEPFEPEDAILGCCELLTLKAQENGVNITTRISSPLPELVADRRAFNQILINLISNAIKFTPRAGQVTVSAYREGMNLTVVVEDTGIGIGEEDLPRLGEAFFQGGMPYERRKDGTGLGLSIVKGLVRLHRGDLDISSRLNKGTRVIIRLPIHGEKLAPTDWTESSAALADELNTSANVQVKKSA